MLPGTDVCIHGRSLVINGVPLPVWCPAAGHSQIYVWTSARMHPPPPPPPQPRKQPPRRARQQSPDPPPPSPTSPTLLHPTPLRPVHAEAAKLLQRMNV